MKHFGNHIRANLLVLVFLTCLKATAAERSDSVKVYFPVGDTTLQPSFGDNSERLLPFLEALPDSLCLRKVTVVGSTSPEGGARLNRKLANRRAQAIFDHVALHIDVPDSLRLAEYRVPDWEGLMRLVEADPMMPAKEKTVALIRRILGGDFATAADEAPGLRQLKALDRGVPYRYMKRAHFPLLRTSTLVLTYDLPPAPAAAPPVLAPDTLPLQAVDPAPAALIFRDTVYVDRIVYSCPECTPFYMSLKTNMLQDLLLTPNLGVEFYLGRNWSAGADWHYAWWRDDRRHRYWRNYGGDIYMRRWFGRKAQQKPLTGQHIGVYAGVFTYDIEWGGRGYMGGKPGGDIFDRANYTVGVEYGYSLPVAERLNIDFSLGVGYWGGKHLEYRPQDGCYVWEKTKNRHYFGPTRLEISLVWQIGCGNSNEKFAK